MKWVLAVPAAIGIVGGLVIFFVFDVCEEQLAMNGDVVEVCRKLRLTDPPAAAIGVFILVAMGGFFTEFSGFGLAFKREVKALEDKGEEDYGVAIEEVRGELNELRAAVAYEPTATSTQAAEMVKQASLDYERFNGNSRVDWQGRIDVDKRLRSNAARMPTNELRQLVEQAKRVSNQHLAATSMAAAVVLAMPVAGESDADVAKMLADLLESGHERVRFRAAQSVRRRAQRHGTSKDALQIMTNAVSETVAKERAAVVATPLVEAAQALRDASL